VDVAPGTTWIVRGDHLCACRARDLLRVSPSNEFRADLGASRVKRGRISRRLQKQLRYLRLRTVWEVAFERARQKPKAPEARMAPASDHKAVVDGDAHAPRPAVLISRISRCRRAGLGDRRGMDVHESKAKPTALIALDFSRCGLDWGARMGGVYSVAIPCRSCQNNVRSRRVLRVTASLAMSAWHCNRRCSAVRVVLGFGRLQLMEDPPQALAQASAN